MDDNTTTAGEEGAEEDWRNAIHLVNDCCMRSICCQTENLLWHLFDPPGIELQDYGRRPYEVAGYEPHDHYEAARRLTHTRVADNREGRELFDSNELDMEGLPAPACIVDGQGKPPRITTRTARRPAHRQEARTAKNPYEHIWIKVNPYGHTWVPKAVPTAPATYRGGRSSSSFASAPNGVHNTDATRLAHTSPSGRTWVPKAIPTAAARDPNSGGTATTDAATNSIASAPKSGQSTTGTTTAPTTVTTTTAMRSGWWQNDRWGENN